MSAQGETMRGPGSTTGPVTLARRIRDAVDAAERILCGNNAVHSRSVAEGLALAGCRAARLHAAGHEAPSDGRVDAPWVDHHVGVAPLSPGAHAFELLAQSGQEAVDHCLVAHRLAAYLGRPGRCTIDEALAESVELIVLPAPDEDLPPVRGSRRDDAIDAVRSAFEEVSRRTGRALDPAALVHLDGVASSRLLEVFGEGGIAPPAPGAAIAPVAVAGLPAGAAVEELLLDAVSGLGRIDTPMLGLGGAPPGPLIVTVGDRHRDDRPLDLLFLAHPGALAGAKAVERLAECGTLLVRARTEDPSAVWAVLSPAQRAMIVRRRIRLCLVAPEIDGRDGLRGAILAAVPEIGRAVGVDGSLLEHLDGALRGGYAGLITADPSRLGEPVSVPAAAEPAPALMPVPGASADSAWRDTLRRFHFTGVRPEADPVLAAPLRPAILDAADLQSTPARWDDRTLLDRWSGVVLEDRRRRREELVTEAAALAERLRAALGLSAGPAEGELAASLGEIGTEFVNAGTLRERMSRARAAADLPEPRARRLMQALQTLESYRDRSRGGPIAHVLGERKREAAGLPEDVSILAHPDALRAAVGLFDGLAQEMVALAKALRVARLEIAGEYDDAVHGPVLSRLDGQSLTDEELFSIPAVAVVATADHLRGPALAAFSELIRSARPIHVLVSETVSGLGAEPGYHPGLGYLAVAHREALVVQSSLGRPEHLAAAMEIAKTALEPAVMIAAVPAWDPGVSPREQLEAAVQGRATPCFVYNPAGGATWSERFVLEGNPQDERPWPTYRVPYRNEDGAVQEMEHSFTFAHAAAIDPQWRSHFLVIRPEAWLEDQVEIAEYLELGERERSRSVPFLWTVDGGRLARAVIRWELAFACRDRGRAWRNLQELAGTDNAYARRAAEEARAAAQQEADRRVEKLEADFAIALESARARSAEQAVYGVVNLLADPAAFEAATAAVGEGAPPPTVSLPGPPAPSPGEPVATEHTAVAEVGEPYVDSFLCTSCDDCINLNSRMFRYNPDKQAEIADPSAGTFEQLVKAAEKCPARCIHPGRPRESDATATPAMIKRAEKYQ